MLSFIGPVIYLLKSTGFLNLEKLGKNGITTNILGCVKAIHNGAE